MSAVIALLEAAGSLDVARVVVEQARAAGRAATVYRLDATRERLVHVPNGTPHPSIPRGDHVAWAAVEAGTRADGAHGVAVPLHSRGAVCGVVLLDGPPGPLDEVLEHAGAALGRAIEADRQRWDAAMLEALLPLLDDGVMLVTTDGEVVRYGDVMARIVGWTREDVVARGWTNLVYATDEERTAAQQAIAALVLGHPSQGTQRALVCKDGSRITAGIWSGVVPHPGGGAPGLLGVVRDETPRADAQRDALRQDHLVQLGKVARMVAHDFNNLLCAIMGHADLIRLGAGTPELQQRARSQLLAAEKGAELVRQLLAFGSPAAMRTRPVGLAGLAREVAELFAAGTAEVQLEVEVLDDATAEVDPAHIHQAVMNLLANARDAAGAGGRVVLRVATAPLPAEVAWRAPQTPSPGTPMATVAVVDDGPGFADGVLAHVFEPFFTTREGGNGVGLAAVRGIVAQHGGAIEVAREGGARVRLFLPLSTRPEAQLEALRRRRGARSGTVWIADADPLILEFSQVALSADGFDVHTFRTGEALVASAGAAPEPQVIVLDPALPGGGGPEAQERLRALGVEAPVLWVSSLGPSGPGRTLQKPYTGRDLADAVEELMRSAPR